MVVRLEVDMAQMAVAIAIKESVSVHMVRMLDRNVVVRCCCGGRVQVLAECGFGKARTLFGAGGRWRMSQLAKRTDASIAERVKRYRGKEGVVRPGVGGAAKEQQGRRGRGTRPFLLTARRRHAQRSDPCREK